jgi:hypothetical protein
VGFLDAVGFLVSVIVISLLGLCRPRISNW